MPAVACTVAATAYALYRPAEWEGSQALVLRDEAVGSLNRQGRFDSPEARKTAQEMVLEMARSPAVVRAALARQAPPPAALARLETSASAPRRWPDDRDVELAREHILVAPPKGSEFGRSEVIYLKVRESSGLRAVELAAAVCDELESRLRDLRNAKAGSLLAELEKSAAMARADLERSTAALETFERELGGSDLGELRTLSESGTGEGNLRSSLNKIKEELRQAEAVAASREELRSLLARVQADPAQLLATPNQLLESQPSLRRLKDGLVDAQLRTSQILGKMKAEHPAAQAALASEGEIRDNLRRELQTAIAGLSAELKVSQNHVAALQTQAAEVGARLDRLAQRRARYANLLAEVRQRTTVREEAERALADARASQTAAVSGSLLTRLDGPQGGTRPLGPPAEAIVVSGLAGGLLLGLGLVVLATPAGGGRGRRWSDYLRHGRRQTDQSPPPRTEGAMPSRRAEDRAEPPQRRGDDAATFAVRSA